ncbi:MAG: pyridoxal phosphate-dependent aminotransferase [Flavobacteriales bacterium]|jgi:aspartate aminotransferase|nr:pyridoxal phosphate-dependent aminotransferase [Flavobacteriales bacterium]MBK6882744.1 pyridoxal phosphate-dependent aminotransferase [Flavobacteriales bacterium]MBK7103480.1 pyridoxal phosphate-dependent aminotransferase [Flavobacteriales bacterium]MBK7114076.1 pyridoxal phosphate-dependent aminotransferase [Flavobacteriales bacterium]MBK7483859.1 pyridoxal phosphate-dependent aminotransferase [Flavobacteriales bacterium]
MPSISKKGQQLPPSPIRKLVPFAEAAKLRGTKVIHLNIGQPDIASPKVALDAIRNLDRTVIEYSHSAGYESYRKGLATYYQGVGVDVTHEQILITNGGSEALLFGMMACFEPGDELIIPEPFYANYNSFAMAAGVTVVPLRTVIEDGFTLPPISAFEALITPRTKGILICNPGNPTGRIYGEDELDRLRDIVKKHDLFLFADEVYREFCYDGATHISAMALDGIDQQVVLIDSVSKRYSMCGARVGALVTKNSELYDAVLKFAQARLSPPTFGQIASEAALKTPASYFTDVITEYKERRDILVKGLNTIPGVVCPEPNGAFYCLVELPIDDSDRFCQWLLEEFDWNGHTVMMAPATGFYAKPETGIRQVRLAYVLKKDLLATAVECLRQALIAYPGTVK